MKKILLFIALLSTNVFPQIVLQHEVKENGEYRLTFINEGSEYSSSIKNAIITSENEQSFDIASRDIFVALPPETRSAIRFTILQKTEVELGDRKRLLLPNTDDAFTFRGYLWIDNYFCAHLTVTPVYYDKNVDKQFEIREFRISVDLGYTVEGITGVSTLNSNPIIENQKYGSAWKSSVPKQQISATDTWINYQHDYVKLGVVRDGLYRMYRSDLTSYGIPVQSVNPRMLKIFLKGKEVPIYVYGEQDNVFNEGDYIEFVGRRNYGDNEYRQPAPFGSAYFEYLNKYSDTSVYWLNWEGTFGKRVDTVTASIGASSDTLRFYDELLHTENNLYWDFSLNPNNMTAELRRNDPALHENESWHEGNLNVGKLSIPFITSNLYPTKTARAFVKLQDYASSITTNAHNLALSINNTAAKYDSGFINKYQVKVLQANFSSSLLVNGSNSVDIHSFATASSINTVIRDWYELEYPRYIRTTTDSLKFGYSSLSSTSFNVIALSGLTGPSVSLYRFKTVDSSVIKITNYVRRNDSLFFTDSVSNGTLYFLLRESKIPAPMFFYKKKFVNLRSSQNKADYIAITHPHFVPVVNNYTSFISSTYANQAITVSVNDIYDEFNYGFFSPEPIKDFLKTASVAWQAPKPKYVVLIGKGTYDFYGNKTRYFGAPVTPNFVPPYGNPVSDLWFVQWDTTGALIPQMNIGRIPSKDINEFQSYALKHQKYVSKGYDDWNKRYIFFSGGNFTDPNQIAQSKGVNEFIINNHVLKKPIGGIVANFYKTTNPITNFGPYSPAYIKDAIDNGGVFISYIGHSGTQTWDNSITDISQLANTRDRNPMISDFGCSTAKFAESDILSFSELAVSNVQGQAISYIGNSSLGYTSTAFTFPQIFYKKLLIDTAASLGDVHRLAKIDYIKQFGTNGTYGLFQKTNTLIGDPIVALPVPTKPNLSVTNAEIDINPETPTDQHDSISITIRYFNFGSVGADSVRISMKDMYQSGIVYSTSVIRAMPFFTDTVTFTVPVRNRPGEHSITITLDEDNKINEIYETDNAFTRPITVATTTIRTLATSLDLNQTDGTITYLSPSVKLPSSLFYLEIGRDQLFSQKETIPLSFDTFYTTHTIDPDLLGKRIWIRSKYADGSGEGITHSYFYGNKTNFYLHDSLAFNEIQYSSLGHIDQKIRLDTNRIIISAISAGLNDGNTAVILKNGQNFIPENTIRGHHVVLFNAKDYEFFKYYYFPIHTGTSAVTAYKNLLDTLSAQYIVVIAISNEGQENLSVPLKNSIKSYGSKYIDSVMFWTSWAIIGRKGAPQGSVPERFSHPFKGRVQFDTTFAIPDSNGSFRTPLFGPIAEWKNIGMKFTEQTTGNITLKVVGISPAGKEDTVKQWSLIDSVLDISDINSSQYPSIRLLGSMQRTTGMESPTISGIEVNFNGMPELGMNYQTVRCFIPKSGGLPKEIFAGDTVLQGEKIDIVYRVYNVGGVPVKNVGLKVLAQWENNTSEAVSSAILDSLGVRSFKEFSASYNTSIGFGKRNLQITIDPDTVVKELYKDNNVFVFPIVVKKNQASPLLPNLAITQSGIRSTVQGITDENDTVRFNIVYGNTGALVNDSITISVKHFYRNASATEWQIRKKYPASNDTITVQVPILKRAGEHSIRVDLDPIGLITESNESDNSASLFFTVLTTDFKIIQPSLLSISSVDRMLFLNPTSLEESLPKIAQLQLDSSQNFTSPASIQSAMREFTSEFTISSLPKKKRYFWRVKQLNSLREWTTGSFYLGDSTAYSLGQIDSIAWMNNIFLRTAFDRQTGARIVDSKFALKAISAGFNDGSIGSVEVNSVNILAPIFGPGHNISVLDTNTFSIKSQRRFDVSNNPADVDSLIGFITSIAQGDIVIGVVVDEGANNMTAAARNALKTIGSTSIDALTFRDSWAIIGRKGAVIGSVPELYKPQGSGAAAVETTIARKEISGQIVTQTISSFGSLKTLSISSQIPSGYQIEKDQQRLNSQNPAAITTKIIGISSSNATDTIITAINQQSISLQSFPVLQYPSMRILFELKANTSFLSPSLYQWTIAAQAPAELAISAAGTTVSKSQIMEGEKIQFSGSIYNLSYEKVDSVFVRIKILQSGIETILKDERFATIAAQESVVVLATFDSRGKKGNLAFLLEVDPLHEKIETSKANNTVTIPFSVATDSIKPRISITIDDQQIVNGDYISQFPRIKVRYTDNNPSALIPADTTNFKIRLNNAFVPFNPGIAELTNSGTPGSAEIQWTPTLKDGENIIQVYAKDVTGNASDTITLFVNVSSQFKLLDVYNIPNPFNTTTHFTFKLAGPVLPDEVSIKIYTVTGRLIQEIHSPVHIGFNKIGWDGRDRDGDQIGNGVYFYRVLVTHASQQTSTTSKLVKMR